MNELTKLAIETATQERVDPKLLQAIVQVESGWNPWAVRFEAAWKYLYYQRTYAEKLQITVATEITLQKMSWGLCQVMGSVARELGFEEPLPQLCDPKLSLTYGAKLLRKLMIRYGENAEADIIAAYNAGSVRKIMGRLYVNQLYVDKVSAALRDLRPV